MSKLSEEEILKYTKNIINATYIEATDTDENGNIIEQGLVNQEVIQGLLDLYNKEKEKNKELEKKLQDKTYKFLCDNPYIDTFDIREVIMKDEIREIIQDIDNNQPVIAELKLRKLVEGDK